jgi:hypothetical protein
MSRAGVAPTACLQRAFTCVVMPWELALLGVICSLAGFPGGRSCLRRVCPKKSNPSVMGVMTVFAVDSLTPRSATKALIRGRIVSSHTARELAVPMKSSAHLTSLMLWSRRCHVPPCTTASSPSNTKLLPTGEMVPPCGPPVMVIGARISCNALERSGILPVQCPSMQRRMDHAVASPSSRCPG